MAEITVTMKLFGSFRKYGDSVSVPVQAGSPSSMVKKALGNVLGDEARQLINDSVLANDETILPPEFVIEQEMQLAILPPVCGG